MTKAHCILALAAGVTFASAAVRADDVYTYEFTAAPGQSTQYDGSWFTYDATTEQATDWDIKTSFLGIPQDITPYFSGAMTDITSAGPDSFTGQVDFGTVLFPVLAVDAEGVGTGTPGSDSLDFSGFVIFAGPFDNGIWYGTWGAAPDGASAFGLLGGSFAALAFLRSKLRRA